MRGVPVGARATATSRTSACLLVTLSQRRGGVGTRDRRSVGTAALSHATDDHRIVVTVRRTSTCVLGITSIARGRPRVPPSPRDALGSGGALSLRVTVARSRPRHEGSSSPSPTRRRSGGDPMNGPPSYLAHEAQHYVAACSVLGVLSFEHWQAKGGHIGAYRGQAPTSAHTAAVEMSACRRGML